ncbi:MAG: phage holin, LLH family [Kyrpidia sp.]|nr:phage holin, LLH family [Kyrpidia sp.]
MDPWWVPIANQVVLFVLQFLAALALALLHVAGRRVADYLRLHTTRAQRDLLACLAREAFSFAETVYKQYNGPAKLEQAMGYLSERLRQHGVTVTPEEMRAAVEQAWLWDRRTRSPGGTNFPVGSGTEGTQGPGTDWPYDPPGGLAGLPGCRVGRTGVNGKQGLN